MVPANLMTLGGNPRLADRPGRENEIKRYSPFSGVIPKLYCLVAALPTRHKALPFPSVRVRLTATLREFCPTTPCPKIPQIPFSSSVPLPTVAPRGKLNFVKLRR